MAQDPQHSSTSRPTPRRTWTIAKPLGIGLGAMLFLVVGIGLWASQLEISGAVIGEGRVEVSQAMTSVQHPTGGVISAILVQNGDRVAAGDVVLRLEDSKQRSELVTVEGELFETLANMAQLEALIDDSPKMILPPVLTAQMGLDADTRLLVARQARKLTSQRDSLHIAEQMLREQVLQSAQQIRAAEAEEATKHDHADILRDELLQTQALSDKGLMKTATLTALQKEDLRNQADIARLQARVAELRARIAELDLKRHGLLPDLKEKAIVELSKLRPARTKLLERRAALMEEIARLDLRAPVGGLIHDLQVQGLRSVVVAAKPLMFIVPADAPVQVSLRLQAIDIDQVYPGQETSLRFRAFNRRATPIILGEVARISADAFLDVKTNKPYYTVLVHLRPAELAKLEGQELVPGMPVDAFITTQSRTPLSYVMKPLMDYFDRAFRDA